MCLLRGRDKRFDVIQINLSFYRLEIKVSFKYSGYCCVSVLQGVILDQHFAVFSFKFGAESVVDLWTESTNTNGVLYDSGNVHFHTNFELLYGDAALPPVGKLTGEELQEFNCDSAGTSLD